PAAGGRSAGVPDTDGASFVHPCQRFPPRPGKGRGRNLFENGAPGRSRTVQPSPYKELALPLSYRSTRTFQTLQATFFAQSVTLLPVPGLVNTNTCLNL